MLIKNNIKIKLEGSLSNRDAIGAKIYLYQQRNISDKILVGYHEINGGESYASISAKEAIFPLVPGFQYFAIIKFPFPGSEKMIQNLKPGILLVSEQSGFAALATSIKKSIVRAVKDPEVLKEIFKIALVIFLLASYFKRFIRGRDRIMRIRKLSIYSIFVIFVFITLNF